MHSVPRGRPLFQAKLCYLLIPQSSQKGTALGMCRLLAGRAIYGRSENRKAESVNLYKFVTCRTTDGHADKPPCKERKRVAEGLSCSQMK